MTRTNMIVADALFITVLFTVYNSNDLKKYPVILGPLMIIAFAACVIRHVQYYNMYKRIF
jgi:hypothetical protein